MKNQRIIEILFIIKTSIEDYDDLISSGICAEIDRLLSEERITFLEKEFLKELLNNNKPNEQQFTQFTKNIYWSDTSIYWWTPIYRAYATAQIRANYLYALIKKLKDGDQ